MVLWGQYGFLRSTETHPIDSAVPFLVYLSEYVDGCKVQFADPSLDLQQNTNWQDLPNGEITADCPMVEVPGGSDITFRVLAPDNTVVAKMVNTAPNYLWDKWLMNLFLDKSRKYINRYAYDSTATYKTYDFVWFEVSGVTYRYTYYGENPVTGVVTRHSR